MARNCDSHVFSGGIGGIGGGFRALLALSAWKFNCGGEVQWGDQKNQLLSRSAHEYYFPTHTNDFTFHRQSQKSGAIVHNLFSLTDKPKRSKAMAAKVKKKPPFPSTYEQFEYEDGTNAERTCRSHPLKTRRPGITLASRATLPCLPEAMPT